MFVWLQTYNYVHTQCENFGFFIHIFSLYINQIYPLVKINFGWFEGFMFKI